VRLLGEFEDHDDTAIHAVYLPERRLSARVRVFIDYLADAFREPPWGDTGLITLRHDCYSVAPPEPKADKD